MLSLCLCFIGISSTGESIAIVIESINEGFYAPLCLSSWVWVEIPLFRLRIEAGACLNRISRMFAHECKCAYFAKIRLVSAIPTAWMWTVFFLFASTLMHIKYVDFRTVHKPNWMYTYRAQVQQLIANAVGVVAATTNKPSYHVLHHVKCKQYAIHSIWYEIWKRYTECRAIKMSLIFIYISMCVRMFLLSVRLEHIIEVIVPIFFRHISNQILDYPNVSKLCLITLSV